MKKYLKIFPSRVSKISFLPLNMRALALVLMPVIIAMAPALPITAAPEGPVKNVSYFRFYMEKRQWLADARTVVAGIHYVCESRASEATCH